ncbi:dynein-related subfamily AAA family protein [Flavobacterium sp. 90]|uniref:McrB family protein n=1 Tax=unclassified Flavobacterium TaxID=196869 RepID=UPI000EB4EEE1|nr:MULTISPECIES: AAA family ATPase [unclassified Flavobacterium]RKR11564.1 dynein-related subfamily AAA family protein [Flavobacterium sp. 81]TCK55345.1 dynein-related subfamily AAA family protein [Flavobacterium sp. 90]
MIKERIEQYLTNQFTERIINTQDFFFQKGQDALQKWLNLSINNEDKSDLEKLAADYEGLQKLAIKRQTINEILNLLFEIISYCDSKAKSKDYFNQYDDNRTLAMAYVRMNHWVEKLITFKFNPNAVPVGSIRNAINYLLDPTNNATILSENHRTMISQTLFQKEYNPNDFIKDLEEYFSYYQINVSNIKNYTYLLSCIIYFIRKEWLDDIIGLMASDNTPWKDNAINNMQGSDCTILWNSKRPTGTNNTLKMLRSKINDGGYFKLFYSVHGNVQYVAEIIDFVENDIQLKEKNWPSKFKKIDGYENDFTKYNDDNKSANIVFLTRKFERVQSIPATSFATYKGWAYPVQDNLTPIISEPDITTMPTNNNSATSSIMNNNNKSSLNQILYGPPGTGKTYKLQQIIEDWNLKEKTSTEIDYTSFVKNYTWWQVIGLALLEKENITVPELAKHPLIIAKLGSSSVKRLNTRLWSSLQHHTVDECENVKLAHRVGERVFYKEANSEWRLDSRTLFQLEFIPLVDAFEEFKKSDDTKKSKDYTFTTCHQSLTYEDFIEGIKPDLSKENLEDDEDERSEKVIYEIRKGIFYNACEKASQKAGFINLKDCLEHTKDERKYLFEKAIAENKIHVIFLDEINRCNVSSVFGELITLIEDDKRLGKENEIADITLPYSQEEFGVPANLFIIGTMNTADRSVEALDAALRRRFCFEEMPPLYSLEELQNDIFGYKASEILKTINLRIEKLLDKDHKIGHSYLLNKDKISIIDSFYKNIIPLLQEYFFGDYSKIGLVLGKGFVSLKESDKGLDIFADFDDAIDDFDNKNVYEIVDYRKGEDYRLTLNKVDVIMDFEKAIQVLMNK